jgi:hypothetical protein
MILPSETFSADVQLHLHVGGRRLDLGQLGPDFGILRTPEPIDATEGELETIINGKSSRWKIRINSPIALHEGRFTFEAA